MFAWDNNFGPFKSKLVLIKQYKIIDFLFYLFIYLLLIILFSVTNVSWMLYMYLALYFFPH